jgi:hypothetical protein
MSTPYQLPLQPDRPLAPSAGTTPATYVPLSRRLLEDLRDAPVAVGVFALIARLYLISGEAVPLSPGDLQAYDPSLSYGAARRAFERLVATGYALVSTGGGSKLAYFPSWGQVSGAPLPWDRQRTSLGRPRHIRATRLDDRLLDLYLGRLRPHRSHRAVVERYLTTPLLGLREVGTYALALAGLPVSSPALASLGLLTHSGEAQPLPDDRTILAVASQRAAGEQEAGALTPAGWRHAGFIPLAPAGPSGTALFFVPNDMIGGGIGHMIGHMIGHQIGMPAKGRRGDSSSGSHRSPFNSAQSRSHGSTDQDGKDSTTPALPARTRVNGGGGKIFSPKIRTDDQEGTKVDRAPTSSDPPLPRKRHENFPPPHAAGRVTRETPAKNAEQRGESDSADETPVGAMLRSIGVRSDIASKLADRPAAQVAHVIATARARPGVRDVAAWVVSALRALPDHVVDLPPVEPERPLSARPIYFHPDLTAEQRSQWLIRFRRAQTPAEQRAVLMRLEQEHPQEHSQEHPHE